MSLAWSDYYTGDGRGTMKVADAEQAKATGGMLALRLRDEDAQALLVPGGEPVEDLHLTLCYFGEDVTDLPGQDLIAQAVSGIADHFSAITARVMSHATFNPDWGDDGTHEPCAVYIVSDSTELDDLHTEVIAAVGPYCAAEQHRPWLPHITAGYSLDASALAFTGEVTFDRLSFEWAGTTQEFPLL